MKKERLNLLLLDTEGFFDANVQLKDEERREIIEKMFVQHNIQYIDMVVVVESRE